MVSREGATGQRMQGACLTCAACCVARGPHKGLISWTGGMAAQNLVKKGMQAR